MTLIETLNQEIDYLVIQEKKYLDAAKNVKAEDEDKFIAMYNKSLGIRFSIDRLKKIAEKFGVKK